MTLRRQLARWEEAGILTARQTTAIREFELSRSGFWPNCGFAGLGVFAIVLGVIALVASNWQAIPPQVKLAFDALGFGVLGWLMWHAQFGGKEPNRLRIEALVVALMGWTAASIGLIAQIYQLSGPLHETLLFWSVLTAPVMALSRRTPLLAVWALALLGGLTGTLDAAGFGEHAGPWLWCLITLPLLIAAPTWRVLAAAVWVMVLLGGLGHWLADAGLAPKAAIGFVLCLPMLLVMVAHGLQNEDRTRDLGVAMGLFGWLGFLVMWLGLAPLVEAQHWMNAARLSPSFNPLDFDAQMVIPAVLLVVAMAVSVVQNRRFARPEASLIVAALGLFAIMLMHGVVPLWRGPGSALAIHILAVASAMLLAMYAALAGRNRLFSLLTLLIGGRLMWLYIDLLGPLSLTGVGLISTGVMILLLVHLWNRYRVMLEKRIQSWHGM